MWKMIVSRISMQQRYHGFSVETKNIGIVQVQGVPKKDIEEASEVGKGEASEASHNKYCNTPPHVVSAYDM